MKNFLFLFVLTFTMALTSFSQQWNQVNDSIAIWSNIEKIKFITVTEDDYMVKFVNSSYAWLNNQNHGIIGIDNDFIKGQYISSIKIIYYNNDNNVIATDNKNFIISKNDYLLIALTEEELYKLIHTSSRIEVSYVGRNYKTVSTDLQGYFWKYNQLMSFRY